jgi:extracellular elastinolytic metalloproteinase
MRRTGAFSSYEWCTRPRLLLGTLGLGLLFLVSAPASPARSVNQLNTLSGADRVAGYLDVREPVRAQLTRRFAQLRAPSRASRDARRALARRLGRHGMIDIDPLTGTPRLIARADHPLSGPKTGSAAAIAKRYVRANLAALGLTRETTSRA